MKMSPGHLFYFSFIISFCSLVTYEKSSAKKKKKSRTKNFCNAYFSSTRVLCQTLSFTGVYKGLG